MSDFGIFQALADKLHEIDPKITVFGQRISDMDPPYAILQLGVFEKKLIPQKTAYQKTDLNLVSRFKGEAEIQHLEQSIREALEGMKLKLNDNAIGLIVWDESQLSLEKDNITRIAHLKFTIRIKFS